PAIGGPYSIKPLNRTDVSMAHFCNPGSLQAPDSAPTLGKNFVPCGHGQSKRQRRAGHAGRGGIFLTLKQVTEGRKDIFTLRLCERFTRKIWKKDEIFNNKYDLKSPYFAYFADSSSTKALLLNLLPWQPQWSALHSSPRSAPHNNDCLWKRLSK